MCHCRNILNSSVELGKETSVPRAPHRPTDRSKGQYWPHCCCVALDMLVSCLGRRNCFAPLSLKVGLCETCSSFSFGTQIELLVACPGILFLASNPSTYLRFLFHLLKYDCDNFISTACTAPLAFKRQSDWLWASGTWPWERYRLFMLWKPSVLEWCVRACVWYNFVRPWQTQDAVLRCFSLPDCSVFLSSSEFSWQLCRLFASLLSLFFCLLSIHWRVVDNAACNKQNT